ncbi:FHA domain-containing protein [Verminephrobacter aporrectodeae]|uniref:FHA domain-containing protein n=1 Tax=Verminephrobacter aporrectodeae TaxID=1110389 RepID=UPI002242CC4A|nr:FHA domain-containing protein [Verminephrobacter aporrectodeae]MCW8177094.1 FHA domain-containing protein [Verminephrobacter aporrectodeae subsp. tuberculatae]MCW8202699.1 FHA domain-containing protein [Verminephrobacter aporrectodeae subsp. tuberculatae]
MPRMIFSIDGNVIKDVQLTQTRTTLGRRPYNDMAIDDLAVSGEHAVIHMVGREVQIEDLGSTNGTYVNAKPVKRQTLRDGDTLEVGQYKIRFLQEAKDQSGASPAPAAPASTPMSAIIRVLSGRAAGGEVSLQKVVTTIGQPGVAIAAITKQPQDFVLTHIEGRDSPLLNGVSIGPAPIPLKHGDRLELAGTQMQFEQSGISGADTEDGGGR